MISINSSNPFNECTSTLYEVYQQFIYPLEKNFYFSEFYGLQPLSKNCLSSKPLILVLGLGNSGKTSFIQQLIGEDAIIAEGNGEFSSKGFKVIYHGDFDEAASPFEMHYEECLPFQDIKVLGKSFVHNHLQGCRNTSEFLKNMTFVEVPDPLEAQGRIPRYEKSLNYFCNKAAKIFLLLDVEDLNLNIKNDFNNKLKNLLTRVGSFQDKLSIVFNKCDHLETNFQRKLRHTYGEFMYFLGGLSRTYRNTNDFNIFTINTREHFDDEENRNVLQLDWEDIKKIISDVAKEEVLIKRDKVEERANMVKIHSIIMSHLRSQVKSKAYFERAQKTQKQKVADKIAFFFKEICRIHRVDPKDCPNLEKFREVFNSFPLEAFFNLPVLSDDQNKFFASLFQKFLPSAEDMYGKSLRVGEIKSSWYSLLDLPQVSEQALPEDESNENIYKTPFDDDSFSVIQKSSSSEQPLSKRQTPSFGVKSSNRSVSKSSWRKSGKIGLKTLRRVQSMKSKKGGTRLKSSWWHTSGQSVTSKDTYDLDPLGFEA
eukprot:maker-scaffold_20-snap-gene-2.2-mRNA-1 protein AED:0.00 eAED:0.00 QI:71/1/1/1/1/1/3/96/539